ncbi:Recombination inhibitory protein MutS2 [Anaerostipes rhamnosivorans]|uniref:Endonuclease MutS2 n=2 Tax=Anaerostipes rhamnosivorans TaxID=1229621 RepID=A0A4P8IAC0_9FIRM|nr:Recombination inhibitory protein MutS2 [Anaerostipes rhamnosivorans]
MVFNESEGIIMNQKVLNTLEYDKVIERLAAYATTELGREACETLQPMTQEPEISLAQEQTQDALTRLYKQGSISFFGVQDLGASLKRLKMKGTLSAGELLEIAGLLEAVKNALSYGAQKDDMADADSLDSVFESLVPMDGLLKDIRHCIISPEEISDDASSALKDIRRSMKLTNQKIHSQLTTMVSSSANKDMLQDAIVTMRNGRYCIPVKQEYRGQFKGMIHDQSSSGSTLFIEPMAVVTLNNQLKELEGQEQTEIERILSLLSEQASYDLDGLAQNQKLLIQLDFIFAKAKYAKDYNGSKPIFREDGVINIKQGRHPLLDSKKVVPINVTLGDAFSMLVITGPNTGGKTVSLKTVGLFTLMGQAGLHIPAFQGSSLGIYEEVFADIGDEQSIEQNLSTFSSHMTNIVSIIQKAHKNSLVLLDELCGGTDPVEGAALAISILTDLHDRGVKTMATTHYSELKMFALSTEGVENASCEFDVETLSPTYRLMIGIPGKSNAFAISQKLGLDNHIIDHASGQIDQSVKDFETILADLEKSKQTIEQEQEEIFEYRKEIESLRQSLKERQENIKEKREKLLREAREEAYRIISEAKDTADETIKEYNKLKKQSGKDANRKMEHMRSDLRGKMSGLEKDMAYRSKKRASKKHEPGDFQIGDEVYVTSLSLNGTVQTLPNSKGDLYVQMGMMRSKINVKDLEITKSVKQVKRENARNEARNSGRTAINKSSSIRPEINVLGMTVDEAISQLDKFIDDACLANLGQITVIHGKGTGALRKGIHNYLKTLKKQKRISGYQDGEFGEGDMGVTVIML